MKVLAIVLSYLLGSIPTGYALVRLLSRRDVRDLGSGSTGATNVLRVKGWRMALPVAIFDVAKGFLPVYLALRLFDDPVFAALCGLLAVVGHCFPFAIGFRGGKGMATSIGAFAAIAWAPLLASLGVFVLAVSLTRFVSLGSILAAAAFPAVYLASGGPPPVAAVALAIGAVVVWRHKSNIGRLVRGTERRLGERTP
jgi:glycerol-3-phosphate acyltransferase PlsY